jgi:two-component system, OmpR family, sensor histidine kinase ChvG
MASGIDSTSSEAPDPQLRWSGRWTLTHRILALNVLTLLLVVLSTLYLDVFRHRLSKERTQQTRLETAMAAAAMSHVPEQEWPALLATASKVTDDRFRLYGADGALLIDSWRLTGPTYQLQDPNSERWTKAIARSLDRGFNVLVGAPRHEDYAEPTVDRIQAWPEAMRARKLGRPTTKIRDAPDLTPVISSAVPFGGNVLLATDNDRTFTHTVRRERAFIIGAMALVVAISVLLSIFLARTIVRPLRRLAIAAHRVRLGRAREVKVPRLPKRSDEIGLLARAVSDMSQSLRQRIDNIEAFAADVTHELKNPLASLRSAVDGLDRVEDPDQRHQRSGADRRRASPRDLRARRPRLADRADRGQLGGPARERRRPDRLCKAAEGHRGGDGKARPAGAGDQRDHRQCGELLAPRRTGRDRRRARRRRGPDPDRRRRPRSAARGA